MPGPYEIVITRPCRDAPGKFTAESSFGRKFSMPELCRKVKGFEESRCSDSLGVARFDYKGKTLILYRSGRIDLRRVADRDDAAGTMAEIEALFGNTFEQAVSQ